MVVDGEVLVPSIADIGLNSLRSDTAMTPCYGRSLFYSSLHHDCIHFSTFLHFCAALMGDSLQLAKFINAASDAVIMFLREAFTLLPPMAHGAIALWA